MHKTPQAPDKALHKSTDAYIFWLGCLFQLYGLHRLYNGKIATGLLWMCTFGLLGVGQLIDLFLIPNMVEDYNTKLRAKMGLTDNGVPLWQPIVATSVVKPTRDRLMVQLVQAAAARNGKISVSQAVMDTEASFLEVEATLREMLKSGYVAIENHPDTGVIIYHFLEL